jgi:hypothetical protein
METLSLEGRWSLPNISDSFYGVLSFDPEKGAKLKIKDVDLSNIDEVEIIHGVSSTGELITLYSCSRTNTHINSNSFGSYYENFFYCDYIFEGWHFKCAPTFKKVSVNLSYLTEWIEKDGIFPGLYKGGEAEIKCKLPEEIKLGSDSECSYSISFSLKNTLIGTFVTTEHKVVQKAWFNIEFNEDKELSSALQKIRYFSGLLSFVLKKSVSIQEFNGKSEHCLRAADGESLEQIKGYFFQMGFSKETVLHNVDILRYRHLFEMNPKFIIEWVSLNENDLFRPVFYNFVSEYYMPSNYIDRKFVNYSRALEVLHRGLSRTNETRCFVGNFREIEENLLKKLKDSPEQTKFIAKQSKNKSDTFYKGLIELTVSYGKYAELFSFKQIHFFCRNVSGWRNSLVHGDLTAQPEIKKSLGEDLILLNKKIEILLRIYLLKLIGMDDGYINAKFPIIIPEEFEKKYIYDYVESRISDPDVKMECVKDIAYTVYRFLIVSAGTLSFYRSEKISETEAERILKILVDIGLIEHNGQVSSEGYKCYAVKNEIRWRLIPERYVEEKSEKFASV